MRKAIKFVNIHIYMKSKGFTLVELLVVISIIGVISSIVFLSFGDSREKARLAKAQQFAAQINHVLGAYAVSIWRFEEGSGITLHDESGFGNDGTFNGNPIPIFPDGVYSNTKALWFDGTDDYVDCGDPSNGTLDFGNGNWAIESWIYIEDTSGIKTIMSKGSISMTTEWAFYFSADQLKLVKDDDWVSCVADATGFLNSWKHIIAQRDGDDGVIFIDGLEVEREANFWQGCNLTNNRVFAIGGMNEGTFFFFKGIIDNVNVYGEALSSTQIQQRFAQGAEAHGITINDR